MTFSAWLGDAAAIPQADRAALAWNRIQDKKTDVAFKNAAGTTLAVQSVRLEYDDSVSQSESAAGAANKRKLVIFGIKGHTTLSDTDIKKGYRFVLNNQEYRVESVIFTIGEVQAIAEVI